MPSETWNRFLNLKFDFNVFWLSSLFWVRVPDLVVSRRDLRQVPLLILPRVMQTLVVEPL